MEDGIFGQFTLNIATRLSCFFPVKRRRAFIFITDQLLLQCGLSSTVSWK